MSSKDIAIKAQALSKRYRIGLKEHVHDSLGGALIHFLKSPLDNYRKYRGLYKFDDIKQPSSQHISDENEADIVWALRDISFNIKRGELVGIIGKNGAGKSTLLKVLCKIATPTGGFAEIRGKVSSLLEVGTGFHPELTGRDNIYLNGTILGMRKKEVDRKFDEIVDFSGVERFIDTPVKRFSSGMKVRLAFSVAAHLEPEILIIDEVLAVGDVEFQKKCLEKMEDVGKHNRTVLFVSHNMQAVTRLCKRTILLHEGRVIKDGPSSEVVKSYINPHSDSTAVREWLDPANAPGGDVARLRAVRIRTEDGEDAASVDIRKPVALEMEYDVIKPGYVLLPHFRLINEEGVLVFVTLDMDSEWRRKPRPAQRFISTAWIPGNFLAEGLLYVSPVLVTLSPTAKQFFERDTVSFYVIDSTDGDSARGDWGKKIGGVVRPLLKWQTQCRPYPD